MSHLTGPVVICQNPLTDLRLRTSVRSCRAKAFRAIIYMKYIQVPELGLSLA